MAFNLGSNSKYEDYHPFSFLKKGKESKSPSLQSGFCGERCAGWTVNSIP